MIVCTMVVIINADFLIYTRSINEYSVFIIAIYYYYYYCICKFCKYILTIILILLKIILNIISIINREVKVFSNKNTIFHFLFVSNS